jgi:hypothetical protein
MRRTHAHVPPLGWQIRSVAVKARDAPERLAQVDAVLLAEPPSGGSGIPARDATVRPRAENDPALPRDVVPQPPEEGAGAPAGRYLRPRLAPAPGA